MFAEWREIALRHTPPMAELLDAGKFVLGPAAGAAFIIFALDLLCFGKKCAVGAGSWAVLIGFGLANYLRLALPWWPDRTVAGPIIAWHWLALLFLLFQHDGMLGREGRSWPIWLRRFAICALAAWTLVPANMQAQGWPTAAFGLLLLMSWAGCESLARNNPGGAVPLALGSACLGAAFLMAHAHSARLADALSMPGAALVGVALVAIVAKVDASGALPGPILLLPSLLLVGQQSTFSEIPWHAFLLAALPPVAIGLLAIPPISKLTGFWRWLLFWALCLGPTIAAAIIAVQRETLIEEW